MQIQILNVTINTKPTAKGSYQEADVAYKNKTFGDKVEGKKVMSFGAGAPSFKVLATAQAGEVFDVEVVKNDKGFNDWVSMTKATTTSPATVGTVRSTTTPKSTYETSEERAIKQAIISRQSAINSACNILSVGAKKLEVDDVLKVAQQLNDWVYQKPSIGPTGFEDFPDVPDEFDPPKVV